MFTVTFYQFSKKENSTKLPAQSTPSVQYNCLLKDSCTVTSPVLKLHDDGTPIGTGTVSWNATGYNYCYIPDWQRYYFIRDWQWNKPLWECYLEVDPLASFRSLIMENTKYVLRSAYDYNQDAFDEAYAPTGDSQLVQTRTEIPHYIDTNWLGYVVLGVSGKSRQANMRESINYYILDTLALQEFYEYLFTNVLSMDWQSTQDWNAVISKAIVDPLDYIVSAFYVPISLTPTNFSTSITEDTFKTLNFGFWSHTLQDGHVYLPDERVFQLDVNLTTPIYPYTSADGITGLLYEKLPPFANYFVDLGAGGIHKVNGMLIMKYGGVHVRIEIDIGTGIAVYQVSPSSPPGGTDRTNIVLLETSAQFCPPIPIGRQKSDILGMIAAASNIVTQPLLGASRGGIVGAAIGTATGVASGIIGSGMEALSTSAMAMSGSIGSKAAMTKYISLNAHYIKPQPQNSEEIGFVLCEDRKLSTLSGYTLCADGEITEVPLVGSPDKMYLDERRSIAKYLTTGFYIE